MGGYLCSLRAAGRVGASHPTAAPRADSHVLTCNSLSPFVARRLPRMNAFCPTQCHSHFEFVRFFVTSFIFNNFSALEMQDYLSCPFIFNDLSA